MTTRGKLETGSDSLLELDPELGRAIPAADRERAAAQLTVPVLRVPAGAWDPGGVGQPGSDLGLLISDGLLIREVTIERGRSLELLGPGDIIRPWQEDASSFCASAWRVLSSARLAVLGEPVTRAIAEWPRLAHALVERATRRSRFIAHEAALSNIVGIERRVHALLWQLAEKWGRVDGGTVVVTIPLTHKLLAEMVGARRPSVTQALGALIERGAIEARSDRCWALLDAPPEPVRGSAHSAAAG